MRNKTGWSGVVGRGVRERCACTIDGGGEGATNGRTKKRRKGRKKGVRQGGAGESGRYGRRDGETE